MILEPLSLDELVDIFDETSVSVLKYYMKKAILLQPETLLGQEPLPIQIPKEQYGAMDIASNRWRICWCGKLSSRSY